MSDTIIKYQCPNCGAPLGFKADVNKLVCESCESMFPADFFEAKTDDSGLNDIDMDAPPPSRVDWNVEGYVSEKPPVENQQGFNCTSCGAEVVTGDTVATECMYCGNPIVIGDNISGMVAPDLILPYKLTIDEAKKKLLEFYEGKPLLPKSFKSNNFIDKITGMYVPFWLFTCSGQGSIKFTGTKSRTWRSGDYKYTNTKYYNVYRAGSVAFDKIPVDASKRMDDNYMEGIEPFDFTQAIPFAPSYMAGYFADKFDENVDESAERATKRVIASVEDSFRKTVIGYDSVTQNGSYVQMHGEDIHYALLPVWMLNTKYEGKMYQFAINGQTGQVAGDLPIDKKKLWLYRLAIAAGSAIPISFIATAMMS